MPPAEPAPAAAALDLQGIHSLWPAVLDSVRGENALLGAALEHTRPVAHAIEGDELTLAFPPDAAFSMKQAQSNERRAAVTQALERVLGRRLRVSYELSETVPGADSRPVDEEELVARFMAEFDAQELPVSQPEGE